jgi:hypothetical protein
MNEMEGLIGVGAGITWAFNRAALGSINIAGRLGGGNLLTAHRQRFFLVCSIPGALFRTLLKFLKRDDPFFELVGEYGIPDGTVLSGSQAWGLERFYITQPGMCGRT